MSDTALYVILAILAVCFGLFIYGATRVTKRHDRPTLNKNSSLKSLDEVYDSQVFH